MPDPSENNSSNSRFGNRDNRNRDKPVLALDKLFDKPPPHSLLAEMALLGGMILDPTIIHDVISVLKSPEAFFLESHAAIYAALIKTYDQKQAGNLVLLAEALADNSQLDSVGGLK